LDVFAIVTCDDFCEGAFRIEKDINSNTNESNVSNINRHVKEQTKDLVHLLIILLL
jgi:hypothetical protein